MQAFVRARDVKAKQDERVTNGDIEDLKVPVPVLKGHDAAYMSPTQSAAQSSTLSTNQKTHDKARTITNVQAKRTGDHFPQYLSPEDEAGFEDIDDFETGFNSIPESKIEQLKQKKLAEINAPRLIDKYIDGDSYPDTTSGRISDDEDRGALIPPAASFPEPGFADFRMAPPPKRSKSQQKPTGRGSARLEDVKQAVAQPFAKASPHRSGRQHLSTNVFQSEPSHGVAKVAEPSFRPTNVNHLRESTFAPSSPKQSSGKKRNNRGKELNSHSALHKQHISDTTSYAALDDATFDANDVEAITASYWPADGANMSSNVPQDMLGTTEQEKHGITLLDYDEADLYNLQYEHLKTQDFDADPRAPDKTATEVQLDLKTSLSPEEWITHFESLNIDEWENAGDWFVSQFSEILSRLKSLRRAKRAEAQKFEQEMEERHNAIVKKRIVIRDTMQGMRTHGAQVLEKGEAETKDDS